ncbi:MAG: hypothetical protein K1X39_02450 [Thermoflexales bacterium]|nr:hypothetical protein [Thermoflexales bacterium]
MSEPETTPTAERRHKEPQTPRGAAAFLFLMLAGYILYWAYLWYVTVIERGIAG